MIRFKNIRRVLAVFLSIISILLVSQPELWALDRMADQAIVRVRGNVNINSVIGDINGMPIDSINQSNTYLVTFPGTIPVDSAVNRLRPENGVLHAQPNFIWTLPEVEQISQSFPDENRPVFTMGISPIQYYDTALVYDINSDTANTFSTGAGVVVAVIDNGIRADHPLFVNSLAGPGYDFVDADDDPSEVPGEVFGHGTFVAGIIKRIAPDCQILPIRAFDADGYGNSFTAAKAIYYALEHGADVINMSFSMNESNLVMGTVIQEVLRGGPVMAAASGNDGLEMVTYPSGYSGVIAVSAIDTADYIADFSNFGYYLDVCAPGVNIYSSLAGEYEWGTWSGTSFSAAMVSGTAALVRQVKPDFNSKKVSKVLRLSANRYLDWGYIEGNEIHYGFGCVDALGAVNGAMTADDNFGEEAPNILNVTDMIRFIYGDDTEVLPENQVGDCNCSGQINILDVTLLVNYIYRGGPEPMCK
nr:S8 family serine peptidase [candidate division Zixibacteria bacterium]